MFLDNEYSKEYFNIVKKYQENQMYSKGLGVYCEKHHIVPRSLGGNNKKDNIVFLSATDHFKCHMLLVKFTEGENNSKMWAALWRMMNKQSTNQQRDFEITATAYEEARKQHALIQSKRMSGKNNPFYGKHHSTKSKETMSNIRKGKTYEEIYGETHALELRQKRRDESTGRTLSLESRLKLSESKLGKKRPDLAKRNLTNNADLKIKIIKELELTKPYKGMYTDISRKLNCHHELVSRIFKNMDKYKTALEI